MSSPVDTSTKLTDTAIRSRSPNPGGASDVDAGGISQGDDDTEIAIFWPGARLPKLYRRACDSSGTEFDPGPSVDDLANALASLEDFEVTAPADVTVSGYEGKRVALTVPMDADVDPASEPHSASCDGGTYSPLEYPLVSDDRPDRRHVDPGR